MYYYDPEIVYTENDFVISPNNYLYVVKKEVSGKNPDGGYLDYFEPYQYADSSTSVAEYEDFINFLKSQDSSTGKKIITVDLLSRILDKYLTGIDASGRITSSIFSNEIWFSDYLGNITKTTCDSDPLDIILEQEDLNNAYFIIQDTIILNELGIVNVEGSDNITGILRQYTYMDINNNLIRVQEVIEPISGTLLFRYSISPDGQIFEKTRTSSWRGSYRTVSVENIQLSSADTYARTEDSTMYQNTVEERIRNNAELISTTDNIYNVTTWTNIK